MSTSEQPLKEDVQAQPEHTETTGDHYDDIAETDGEFPLVDEKMQKILAELLDAEADALGADLAEFQADFAEPAFDEEEFMSHIPYPNIIEGGYDDPSLNPPAEDEVGPQVEQKKPEPSKNQQNQKKQNQKQKQQSVAAPQGDAPQDDDNDGFVTVGKGGKALKNKKNQKNLKAQKSILAGEDQSKPQPKKQQQNKQANQTNQQQNNQGTSTTTGTANNKKQTAKKQEENGDSMVAAQTHFADQKAGHAEVRTKMPGQGQFPFCFVCAKRHDFGDCAE